MKDMKLLSEAEQRGTWMYIFHNYTFDSVKITHGKDRELTLVEGV